jgi:hypothetical protein
MIDLILELPAGVPSLVGGRYDPKREIAVARANSAAQVIPDIPATCPKYD